MARSANRFAISISTDFSDIPSSGIGPQQQQSKARGLRNDRGYRCPRFVRRALFFSRLNFSSMPPRRIFHWRLAKRTLLLGKKTLVMGVVNVTPDSFSDGGRFFSP